MSVDDPRAFDDPSLVPLDSSDRSALARLLARVLDSDRPKACGHEAGEGRAEIAKRLYDQRRRRELFLPADLFGEPSWDILLILYWARHSQRRLTVSAVCASSGAPTTTALRYIDHLLRTGQIAKQRHPTDRRVSWLSLSDETDCKIGQYIDRIGAVPALRPVAVAAH